MLDASHNNNTPNEQEDQANNFSPPIMLIKTIRLYLVAICVFQLVQVVEAPVVLLASLLSFQNIPQPPSDP